MKAATCTATGVRYRNCAVCGSSEIEATPALGHSFTQYAANGDGTWTATCDRCTVTDTRTGAPLLPSAAQPVVNEDVTLNILYSPLALENSDVTALHGKATVGGVVYDNLPLVQTTVGGVPFYTVALDMLTPDTFGTTVTVVLTDGDTVTGNAFEYSVKQYCLHMLADTKTDAAVKTVCMDILNYGEATRLYRVARGDEVSAESITADLPDTYKALATTAHQSGAVIAASGSGAYTFTAANVNLKDDVSLVMKVADAAGLDACKLICEVAGGTTYRLSYSAARVEGGVATYVIPVGIDHAYDTCTVYLEDANEVKVSKTYTLSIASVCSAYENNPGTYGSATAALGAAILNYATSVAAL